MKVLQLVMLGLFLALSLSNVALAEIDLSETLSTDDEDAFDEILEPVMDIYNFVKYIATAVAALVLVGAGIVFMFSGSSPGKREMAKGMVMYVVIGLVIIWIAPLLVDFLVQ
jgi:hypothetical protein